MTTNMDMDMDMSKELVGFVISDLINILEIQKAKYGDIPVLIAVNGEQSIISGVEFDQAPLTDYIRLYGIR